MPRLDAELVIVDAIGGETAGFDHVRFTADDGKLGGIRDVDERRHGRGDDVVGRLVESIDGADEALGCLLDVIDRGDGCHLYGQPLGFRVFFHGFDLDFRIDFTGAVDCTDGLSIRLEFQQQINLLLDRVHIAGTRDIALWLLVGSDEFCTFIVRDGRADNRDVMGGIGDCLGSRCGDGTDEIHLGTDKTLCDILEIRLIRLGILSVDGDILAFFKTAFFEAVDEPFVCGIECVVFNELDNADLIRFAAG